MVSTTRATLTALLLGMLAADAQAETIPLHFIPSDARLIASFDLTKMRGSKLYQQIYKAATANPAAKTELDEAKSKWGFDLEKDLDGVVVSLAPTKRPQDGMLVVLTGRFDEERIMKNTREEGPKVETRKGPGGQWYAVNPGGSDEGGMAFVDGLLVVGQASRVDHALRAKAGKEKRATDLGPMKKLHGATDTAKSAFVLGQVAEVWRANLHGPGQKALETVTGSLDLAQGMVLRAALEMTTDEEAKKMTERAGAQLALAKTAKIPMFGLGALLEKVKIAQKGRQVRIDVDFDEVDVGKISMMVGIATAAMAAGQGGMLKTPPAENAGKAKQP